MAHGISDSNLDSYADMLENFAWGQTPEWGSAKHPPLFAWITGAWFYVFPTTDMAYHFLAYVNVAVGLLGVYKFAQALGHKDLALPSVMLLCMAFPYSTLAVKFNANAILLSLWPWVAFAWAMSLETFGRRGWAWSAVLGLTSALAMLGKYYSGVFLLGIFLSSLSNAQGRAWFTTAKPWLALAVFVIALLPHAQWLQAHDFVTLHYVEEQASDDGVNWRFVFKFAIAPIGYWLVPWLLATWMFTQHPMRFSEKLRTWPNRMLTSWKIQGWADRLFWVAMLPWAITLIFGMTNFVELSLPWAIPIGYGFTLLWLRNFKLSALALEAASLRLTRYLALWFLVALLISPWYAWHQAKEGTENHYLPRREAAADILKGWQQRHPDQPLQWVGGQWAENALLAFYGDAKLRIVPGVPDQFPATVLPLANWQSQPGLLFCALGPVNHPTSTDCPAQMSQWLKAQGRDVVPIHITVQSHGFRFLRDMPFSYVVFDYLP